MKQNPLGLLCVSILFGVFSSRDAATEAAEDDFPPNYRWTSVDKLLGYLHAKDKLFHPKAYPMLRTAYVRFFEEKYGSVIRKAWGGPDADLPKWLEKRNLIKEELFAAIDPKGDDVPEVLAVFRRLWEKYPDKVEEYPALAIAISVVWDQPRNGVFDDYHWQYKATKPVGPVDALGNFHYYSHNEKRFGDRMKMLPWELLCYVVCHDTTMDERIWAIENYGNKTEKLGKAYADIRWNVDMKIKGKPYTLPNQRAYGGVCSCQADFAVQLCRSLGVPAFVGGRWPKYNTGHVWIYWAEIRELSYDHVVFETLDAGRYGNYKGSSSFPQYPLKGNNDRSITLRWSRVAQGALAYRQAKILMRLFPRLVEKEGLSLAKQWELLQKVDEFSPCCVEAWTMLAQTVRSKKLNKKEIETYLKCLERFFTVFDDHPDFVVEMIGDFLAPTSMKPYREKILADLFDRLEAKKRIDLVFDLKQFNSRRLVAENRHKEAIAELARHCLAQGSRYNFLTPLLDDMEKIAGENKGLQDDVAQFYRQFLHTILEQKDKLPKKYCRDMFQRGGKCFVTVGDMKRAWAAKAEFDKIVGDDEVREEGR